MKKQKKHTGKRVSVFIGLKLLELLIIPAIVFVPYWIGRLVDLIPILDEPHCLTFSCFYWNGIASIFALVISLVILIFLVGWSYIIIEKWITYNWKKAGEIVGDVI